MKQLVNLLSIVICLGFFACSGGSNEEANIDYSKHTYFRGKVKQMTIKGHEVGDIILQADTCGNITEITFGKTGKVQLAYNAEGNLVKYTANAEAYALPMFKSTLVEPWFCSMLSSYYDANITLSYDNNKITQFTDAKTGWTEKFSYDKEGRISKIKISDKKRTRFNDTNYSYYEEDGKTRVMVVQQEGEVYVYDAQGRLIEQDGAKNTYNDKNDIATEETLDWNDDEYGFIVNGIYTYTYTYDKKGNWIKREGTHQRVENGKPTGNPEAVQTVTREIAYY